MNGKIRWWSNVVEPPTTSNSSLVLPAIENLSALAEDNRALLQYSIEIGGRSLAEIRGASQRELFSRARMYTRQYSDLVPDYEYTSETKIFLTGHQPILFHPGVWFKNFLLSAVTSNKDVAINLLIDNDLVGTSGVFVPRMVNGRATTETVYFDRSSAQVPFENRRLIDRELFASFPRRLHAAIRSDEELVVDRFWQHYQNVEFDGNLGQALARLRHQTELGEGLQTLELPLSEACRMSSFAVLLEAIVERSFEFHRIYNDLLRDYRTFHKIRSEAHPVPVLAKEDQWLELPFWIWSHVDPQRQRLFARQDGKEVIVSDLQKIRHVLAIGDMPASLDAMEKSGASIRPRALMTTMFARLILSDLFIHGIGGAKYDELTDAIMREFFAVQPPVFVTASATFRLSRSGMSADQIPDVESAKNRIRELQQHPERFISELPSSDQLLANGLVAQKQTAIQNRLTFESPKVFQLALSDLNQQLKSQVQPLLLNAIEDLQSLEQTQAEAQILNSREYSMVCFPTSLLDKLCELARSATPRV